MNTKAISKFFCSMMFAFATWSTSAQQELISATREAIVAEDFLGAIKVSQELMKHHPNVAEGYQFYIYSASQLPAPAGLDEIRSIRRIIAEYERRKLHGHDHDFIATMKRDTYRWESDLAASRGNFPQAMAILDDLFNQGDPLSQAAANLLRGVLHSMEYEKTSKMTHARAAKRYLEAALENEDALRGVGGEEIFASTHFLLGILENNAFRNLDSAISELETATRMAPNNTEYQEILRVVLQRKESGSVKWILTRELIDRLDL